MHPRHRLDDEVLAGDGDDHVTGGDGSDALDVAPGRDYPDGPPVTRICRFGHPLP